MPGKTYNIHEILEFANRAELTLEEFEMSYEEEVTDLAKRNINIETGRWDQLCIGKAVRRAQIGSGIFTVGVYPEIKLPPAEPEPTSSSTLTVGFTDDDGKEHRFKVHMPPLEPKTKD